MTTDTPPIDRFDGRYRFLSNFHPGTFEWRGHAAPSAEHHFQAAKAADPDEATRIRAAGTPGHAKRLGRATELVPGWDDTRLAVMHSILSAKFADAAMRERLLATGERSLVEGNTWGDAFWGVCRGRGENHLGRLLGIVRRDLRHACTDEPLPPGCPLGVALTLVPREVGELVDALEAGIRPRLAPDVSSYARGRTRAWLELEAPLGRTQPWRPGYASARLWPRLVDIWRRVHPDTEPGIGLAVRGDVGIAMHRDASFALPDALIVNLGRAQFQIDRAREGSADRPENQLSVHLAPGDVADFDCKHPHRVTDAAADRWSVVLWRLRSRPARPPAPIDVP